KCGEANAPRAGRKQLNTPDRSGTSRRLIDHSRTRLKALRTSVINVHAAALIVQAHFLPGALSFPSCNMINVNRITRVRNRLEAPKIFVTGIPEISVTVTISIEIVHTNSIPARLRPDVG